MPKIPERLRWAVAALDVQPDDKLLEIGCGHGIAVALICEKLQTGSITALDRSPTMIDAARQKNQSHEAAGKVIFHTAALEAVDLGDARFNKIFAVNVNAFWLKSAELKPIHPLLMPAGALYLFYEPPDASKIPFITDQLRHHLETEGFSIRQTLTHDVKPLPSLCIIATAR